MRTVEYGGDTPIHRQTLRAASGHAFGLVDTSSLKITWGLGFFLGGGIDIVGNCLFVDIQLCGI